MRRLNAFGAVIVVGLAAIAATSMSDAQQLGSNEDEAAIRKVIVEMTEGFNNHDGQAASRMYTEDARLSASGEI
jgi:ketosteroid isomerase-like protein